MRLVHNSIDKILDFNQSLGWRLVVENSAEYYNLLRQISAQIEGGEGDFVLSKNFTPVEMAKNALLIYDFIGLTANNSKTEKLLNAKIIECLNQMDYFEKLSQINALLIEINEAVVESFDIPICYDTEPAIEKFVKLSAFKIQEEQSLLGKILSYIEVYIALKTPKLIVFGAVCAVLSQQDVEMLIKELNYKQIGFLFLENAKKYELPGLKTIIIDEDLCLI